MSSVAKIIVIFIILAFGLIYLLKGSYWNHFTYSSDHKIEISGLIGAFFLALFTYDGWDVLNFGTEEIKNPRR